MNKRFAKISTALATVLLSMILIFACGITEGPTTGGGDDGGSGGDSSLSIMPTAVFSTSPELAAAASGNISLPNFPFAYFFNKAKRGDSGILNPEKLSELFMPLFTGLKKPTAEDLSSGIEKTWIGFYMGSPVILRVEDKTADNTDDRYKYAMLFEYWQDVDKNKTIDTKKDKWVADVYVKSAFEDFSDIKWSLNQEISNPFDPTQHFELKANGIGDDEDFSGSGTFAATSGDYRGSATVAWSKNSTNGKKYVKVEDGYIKYTGTKTSGFFNVTNLTITIDIAKDNSSKVIENSTVVTKDADGSTLTVVKQATTLNNSKGIPTEVAYTITTMRKDRNGVITENKTEQDAKVININSDTLAVNLGGNATNINVANLGDADADATNGKIIVNLSKCPTSAKGKSVKVWIAKPENMIYGDEFVCPEFGKIDPAKTANGVVSSAYGASFTFDDVAGGSYVVYAIIDPNGDFPKDLADDIGKTVGDDFYAYSIGVFVDGRKGDTTVNIGNAAYGEPGWMKFGAGDARPSLKVDVKLSCSGEGSDNFIDTAIAGKTVEVGLFEISAMGIDMNNPVGYGYIDVGNNAVNSTLTGKLYINGIVDLKNKEKYIVAARLYAEDVPGAFYYMDTPITATALKFDNYNNKYYISIPEFVYSEEDQNAGVDYSIYPTDGIPYPSGGASASEYYDDSPQRAAIDGKIDFDSVDRYQADAWFAILMPAAGVNNPQDGAATKPVAFAKVNADGTFEFKNVKKFKNDDPNTPNYYFIVAIGYKNFDVNYDKLRMPYQEDILVLKLVSFEYTYPIFDEDGNWQRNGTGTNYYDSPLGITFNTSGDPVDISWDGPNQVPGAQLNENDIVLNISNLYGLYMSAAPGGGSGLEIGNGDRPVYVSVGFMDPQYMTADRPYWLNDVHFGIKVEKKVGTAWTYVTEYWSNFMDGSNSPMDSINFACSKADNNAEYKFSVLQDAWNPATGNVKFSGSAEVKIGVNDHVRINLVEGEAYVYDPNDLDSAEVRLEIPNEYGQYTFAELETKYAYVELMDDSHASLYIMKVQIGNVSADGWEYFGAKAVFNNIPKYDYKVRAFIDWNDPINNDMIVGKTYSTSEHQGIYPEDGDINLNMSNYIPMLYMNYEKYTYGNPGNPDYYEETYGTWIGDWVEIPYVQPTLYFTLTDLDQKLDFTTEPDAYIRILDAFDNQIEPSTTGYAKCKLILDANYSEYNRFMLDMRGAYENDKTYRVDFFVDADKSGTRDSNEWYTDSYTFEYSVETGEYSPPYYLEVSSNNLTQYQP